MYTLTLNSNQVRCDADGVVFNCVDGLIYYERYKKWMAAGNVPTPVPLAQLQSAAITKTYSDVDAIYSAAVGNREAEYTQAEADARAFKASGYAGTPSQYVTGWATSQTPPLTNQQATDSIIAKADTLSAAKLALRNTRFTAQASMKAATTQAQIDAAVTSWNAFIATTRASLGI